MNAPCRLKDYINKGPFRDLRKGLFHAMDGAEKTIHTEEGGRIIGGIAAGAVEGGEALLEETCRG